MAEQFQTSFMPKKDAGPKKRAKAPTGLLSFIGLFVLIVAIAGSAGVFFYERIIEASIESKKQDLERDRDAFEPALIEELARLDTRIERGGTLVNTHRAPSRLFTLLQETTLENVQFVSFSYSLEEGEVVITMTGEATSFSAVALQSDEFAENEFIREPLFSNLAVNNSGNVTFSFTGTVDPSYIAYSARGDASTSEPRVEEPVGPQPQPPEEPDTGQEQEEEGGLFGV